MFDEVVTLSETVKQNTSTHGCDRIRQEIQILRDELDSFQNTLDNADQALASAIQGLDQLAEDRSKFVEWLDETESTVKEKASRFQLERPEQQVTEFEVKHDSAVYMCVCVCVFLCLCACL